MRLIWVLALMTTLVGGAMGAENMVQNVFAWRTETGVEVRWTTPVPTVGRVEYGGTKALGAVAEEDPSSLRGSTNAGQDSGQGYANNHRATLPASEGPLFYRIVAVPAEGEAAGSEVRPVSPQRQPQQVERGSVPLTIDRGDWAFDRVPITVGVPFAPGQLADAEHVRVMAGAAELRSQAVAVTRWFEDGSVKWLRLSFIAPREAEVRVEYGPAVAPARAEDVAVTLGADGPAVKLDAGALQAEWWRSIGSGNRTIPFPIPALIEDGETLQALVDRVEIESHGPVLAVVRFDGHFEAAGAERRRFQMRLHAWRDLPLARLDFTFENTLLKPEMSSLRSLDLWVDLPTPPAVVTVGWDNPVSLTDGQRLFQREDAEYVVEPAAGGDPAATGKRVAGIIEAGDVRLVMRNFWEQYPSAVAYSGGDLLLGLYPALPAGFYADRKDEDKFYYYLRGGAYEFRAGFSKTHELWLDFSGDEAGRSLNGELPMASTPPEWIDDSGVFRALAVDRREALPGFDERIENLADTYLEHRDRAREYGLMNFGDWYGERTWNWGNLEYDLGHALLDQYARTGYAPLARRAEEILRHQRDVDTRHIAADPRRIGQQWIHSIGHTAGYYDNHYKDMKAYAGDGWSDNRGHIWSQGMFQHYLLGGDRRSWDTARLVSDWAAGPQTTNFRFGNAREPGWMSVLVMGAYNATEDPYYLNAAKLMLEAVREKSLATGDHGFYHHPLPTGHCNCEVKHEGEAGFMLGVLMTGMKMYWERTGDEQVADDIVKIARFIVATMYEPDSASFRYTPCPETSSGSTSTYILLDGLAFAAQRSEDPSLLTVVQEAVAGAWASLPSVGKSAGYALCHLTQGLDTFTGLPGPSLAERYEALQAWLTNPARRDLPTLVPNGDFEEHADGYLRRTGITAVQSDIAHSGRASLKISGTPEKQNEYVVTRYDTGGDPWELTWLTPGETYRLTAWLKVDQFPAGAPAPSLRLATRDAGGSRGSGGTNAYDLTQLGTWQKLTGDIELPDWNTRNYIALNTNGKDIGEVEMYLDDLSLVPVALAQADAYTYLRLDPAMATGAARVTDKLGTWLAGPGTVRYTYQAPAAGGYRLAVKLTAPAGARVVLRQNAVEQIITGTGAPGWFTLPPTELAAGAQELSVELPAEALLGRIVVSDDPSLEG